MNFSQILIDVGSLERIEYWKWKEKRTKTIDFWILFLAPLTATRYHRVIPGDWYRFDSRHFSLSGVARHRYEPWKRDTLLSCGFFGMRREISRLFVILTLYLALMNIRSRRTARCNRDTLNLLVNRILPAFINIVVAWVALTSFF